ncbi:cupin domain-containing protein [Enterococcus saccharolyticus]|uniref:Cupin n=1 Tax=Candidatus Enterococcus willemsii TaxID=1857215 RepID=A0ABQ6YW30_9ENTE|nr:MULTISPECIES: cupin domain-containing protein [Enterococcus]KAF1301899.1 cupin [Enterococcus sp. CU12B]MCD5003470.1 cupin domain-containing protein [Enterococcus saccharolyticus]
MTTATYWIEQLALEPHAEGGYFKQTDRSDQTIETINGERPLYTSILFLLNTESPSHFHRLASDETWFYHEGTSLTVHCIFPDGRYKEIHLGKNIANNEYLSYTVPKGTIFGSSVKEDYALVSCVVAPGFDYQDFELFTQEQLLKDYPQHQAIIQALAYETIP